MSEYRRFTKQDWLGYAGAEKFSNGSDPFIYMKELNNEEVELVVIVDATGAEISMTSIYEENMSWILDEPMNSIQAEGVMRKLVEALRDYTFAPDLSYALDHCYNGVFKDFKSI